jgi:hypothetical protein
VCVCVCVCVITLQTLDNTTQQRKRQQQHTSTHANNKSHAHARIETRNHPSKYHAPSSSARIFIVNLHCPNCRSITITQAALKHALRIDRARSTPGLGARSMRLMNASPRRLVTIESRGQARVPPPSLPWLGRARPIVQLAAQRRWPPHCRAEWPS